MNEYWIVTEDRTGRVICQCGDINDAIMMASFDDKNRSHRRHRFLMDQVVDVEVQKALPNTDIILSNFQENELFTHHEKLETVNKLKLPEGKQKPFIV